jgi:hypothetical protein
MALPWIFEVGSALIESGDLSGTSASATTLLLDSPTRTVSLRADRQSQSSAARESKLMQDLQRRERLWKEMFGRWIKAAAAVAYEGDGFAIAGAAGVSAREL